MLIEQLKTDLKADEGLKLKPYTCTANKLTIGIGRNLDDVGIVAAADRFTKVQQREKTALRLRHCSCSKRSSPRSSQSSPPSRSFVKSSCICLRRLRTLCPQRVPMPIRIRWACFVYSSFVCLRRLSVTIRVSYRARQEDRPS